MDRDRIIVRPTASTPEATALLVDRAVRRGFDRFAAGRGVTLPVPDGARVVAIVDGPRVELRERSGVPDALPVVEVRGPDDIAHAVAEGRQHHGVAVVWTAERVIPLENLLAAAHGHFPVVALLDRLADVPAMLGALEHGADRLIVDVRTEEEVDRLERLAEAGPPAAIAWEAVPVARLAPAGLGDRVIVDTTSLLGPAEGMLVGSAAAFLFHVASEAVGSRFTRPRPFRVNAGAAHSYALLADGTTRYLAELVPGDAVLVAEPMGTARSVRVGRIKIERRPLALIETERGGRRYTVFLQDAETVRLSGPGGRRATTELAVGAEVFGAAFPPARHLGGVVDETIEER